MDCHAVLVNEEENVLEQPCALVYMSKTLTAKILRGELSVHLMRSVAKLPHRKLDLVRKHVRGKTVAFSTVKTPTHSECASKLPNSEYLQKVKGISCKRKKVCISSSLDARSFLVRGCSDRSLKILNSALSSSLRVQGLSSPCPGKVCTELCAFMFSFRTGKIFEQSRSILIWRSCCRHSSAKGRYFSDNS